MQSLASRKVQSIRFSNELFEVLYDTIPTAFVQDAFARSTDTVRSSAARVLSQLPDFELRDDDLEKTLADKLNMKLRSGAQHRPGDLPRRMQRFAASAVESPKRKSTEFCLRLKNLCQYPIFNIPWQAPSREKTT